ncbi:hypothetical protein [Paraburkholderia sacchari]|uniref:hypothetical protein n=1 Tax=Paraburkholderia sacchari TaxID=159450 RepID=UPI001F235637|nr:hypothetical protein [Paraburkholderia sacchari]
MNHRPGVMPTLFLKIIWSERCVYPLRLAISASEKSASSPAMSPVLAMRSARPSASRKSPSTRR